MVFRIIRRFFTARACKYAHDVKGCASTHAETALKLLGEGKAEEAQKNLESLQTHLNK